MTATNDSEDAFLVWLAERNGASPSTPIGIGDDCASFLVADREVLVTTDMLLDGTHFDSAEHTPEQIGRKAVACSLSDIAAMAARPLGCVVAVGLTRGRGIAYAQRMVAGARDIAERYACPVVGGDTTSWTESTTICVTMLGRCPRDREPIRRSGACVGDAVFVTGSLGGSLLGKHLAFEPRIALAEALAERCEPHAMMDISDGLAIDLGRICRASQVGAVLEQTLVERVISDEARALAARDGLSPLEHALHDGEDFELLVVMPEPTGSVLPEGVIKVGRVVESGLTLRGADGRERPLTPRGYDHSL